MSRPRNRSDAYQHPQRRQRLRQAWKESHGNWLLGFAAAIFVAGMFIIWTQPESQDETSLELLPVSEGSAGRPSLPENVLIVRVSTSRTNATGPIRIAIYDSKESFGNSDRAVLKDSLIPVNGFVAWEIDLGMLPEKFAIAAYHDLDDNGVLNRALFNAPVEPYGFSNNARSIVGPPTYEETIVSRPTESKEMEIRVY
ncbi:DUF2141 domain-containing protein [Roseiconus nitratireducens]|nr:DUF2141 domain-containing protein [Roseiconus nitratireducens]